MARRRTETISLQVEAMAMDEGHTHARTIPYHTTPHHTTNPYAYFYSHAPCPEAVVTDATKVREWLFWSANAPLQARHDIT